MNPEPEIAQSNPKIRTLPRKSPSGGCVTRGLEGSDVCPRFVEEFWFLAALGVAHRKVEPSGTPGPPKPVIADIDQKSPFVIETT